MKTWRAVNTAINAYRDVLTLSKAVEHALGCVAQKMGLLDMVAVLLYTAVRRQCYKSTTRQAEALAAVFLGGRNGEYQTKRSVKIQRLGLVPGSRVYILSVGRESFQGGEILGAMDHLFCDVEAD
jgi:hypothetical protein